MAPKKQKQSLADFLADPKNGGSVDWADDLDDLPTGPLPKEDRGPPRRTADWLSSMPDRADRDRLSGPGPVDPARYPPREELPLPTQPPFTAFVGNLSFEATELDVQDFFAPLSTTSVRLVNGHDGRPKGFGYVEFATLDDLKEGLARSTSQMNGRNVRVSVAEARDAKGAGFNSAAEEATQWRRAGPLPAAEPSAGRRGSDRPGFGRFESSGGGFDAMEMGTDGRSGFGSRFTPGAPRAAPRQPESLEPTAGDNASDWRTGKPVSESPSSRRPSASPAQRGGSDDNRPSRRHGDATEVDEKYSSQERLGFGSKFVATPPDSPSVNKRPGFGFDRRGNNSSAGGLTPDAAGGAETWRSARRTSGQPPAQSAGSPNGSGQPAQRKKLELKPRSTTASDADATAAAVTSPTASNPFGSAKPVDASEREREIEAKMAQREKERKEEERIKREKREKAADGVPRGPKAERNVNNGKASGEQGRNGSGNGAARQRSTSKSSPAPAAPAAENEANGDNAASARKASVTGAWGGGRKPSGALAVPTEGDEQGEEAAQGGDAGSTDNGVEETSKAVESVTL